MISYAIQSMQIFQSLKRKPVTAYKVWHRSKNWFVICDLSQQQMSLIESSFPNRKTD